MPPDYPWRRRELYASPPSASRRGMARISPVILSGSFLTAGYWNTVFMPGLSKRIGST